MSGEDKPFEPLPRAVIYQSLETVRDLVKDGHTLPALIMGWATMEAVGRTMLPSRFPKAQTPGRLVDVLAAYGQITPAEAERLRVLAQLRNRAVHGAFQVSVPKNDLDHFLELISRMLQELPIDFERRAELDSTAEEALG